MRWYSSCLSCSWLCLCSPMTSSRRALLHPSSIPAAPPPTSVSNQEEGKTAPPSRSCKSINHEKATRLLLRLLGQRPLPFGWGGGWPGLNYLNAIGPDGGHVYINLLSSTSVVQCTIDERGLIAGRCRARPCHQTARLCARTATVIDAGVVRIDGTGSNDKWGGEGSKRSRVMVACLLLAALSSPAAASSSASTTSQRQSRGASTCPQFRSMPRRVNVRMRKRIDNQARDCCIQFSRLGVWELERRLLKAQRQQTTARRRRRSSRSTPCPSPCATTTDSRGILGVT